MSINYFTQSFGIIHLIRFICLIFFLTFIEIKFPSCNSYLNEFLGFNHQSILFYYILIWISFTFEIYFLVNRLLGSRILQAKKSTLILYISFSFSYFLASCFTLYAILHSTHGHVITQDDFSDPLEKVILITYNCNILRLIGILFGYTISILYFISIVLISRMKD